MRVLTPLVLAAVLLTAPPARAQITDDMGSEQQTEGYGRMFAYVGGSVSVIVVILVIYHVIKGMAAEAARGKKVTVTEDILDEDVEKQKNRTVIPLYLGEKVPDWKIAMRLAATKAALKFLAAEDGEWDRKKLLPYTAKMFREIKAAVEERSAKGLDRLMTPECLEELEADLRKLKKKGERHVYGPVDVREVQVVHFAAAGKVKDHTFVALISAESKDYYADDRSGKRVRGDKKVYAYQEFWHFRRTKERWLVERMRPSGDMDRVLEPKAVLPEADLKEFVAEAGEEHLNEIVGK